MSSSIGTPCRPRRSRTACRALGTEASTAEAVKRHTPSYDTGSAGALPRLSIVRHQLSLALH